MILILCIYGIINSFPQLKMNTLKLANMLKGYFIDNKYFPIKKR